MANAVLETMDFEESALEAITYSCMCHPVLLLKIHIHTYLHAYIQTCFIILAALMLCSVRTYMQLCTYVHSCIFTLHVCDRMAAESIQAALSMMNTTQLIFNVPGGPAPTVYEHHTEQIYLTH